MIEKTEKDSHPVKSGMVKSKAKRERTKPRKLKEEKKEFTFKKENLKIIPLGGLQ